MRGKSFRFVSTHLEADDQGVREAQAAEIISGPADTNLPVVFVADANSNANGDATSPAYDSLINAGFVDTPGPRLTRRTSAPAAPTSCCCLRSFLLRVTTRAASTSFCFAAPTTSARSLREPLREHGQ